MAADRNAAPPAMIHARSKWARACAVDVGLPMMATSSATPSTAPSWRAVWLMAPPTPNCVAGNPATAAALNTGKVRATPRPTSSDAGNQCSKYAGWVVTTTA